MNNFSTALFTTLLLCITNTALSSQEHIRIFEVHQINFPNQTDPITGQKIERVGELDQPHFYLSAQSPLANIKELIAKYLESKSDTETGFPIAYEQFEKLQTKHDFTLSSEGILTLYADITTPGLRKMLFDSL